MAIYNLQNFTGEDIAIDDLPVSVVAPALGNAEIPGGNSAADILASFMIRDHVIRGQLGLIVSGRQIDYKGILKSQAVI